MCFRLALAFLLWPALVQSNPDNDYYKIQEQEFCDRWNDVGNKWNDAALDINRGIFPLAKIKDLDRAITRLRRHDKWPQ